MKVEYTTKTDDSVAMVANKISKNQATILSRTPGEVVALIPIPNVPGGETTYTWVWLSGFEGAFISEDSSGREATSIAKIIIQGEWQFQPNAKMILEGKG